MICELLALTEITHELAEMQKSEFFSPYCSLLADRCNVLRYALKDLYRGANKESDYGIIVLNTYTMAKNLYFYLLYQRRRSVLTERDIV
jgi:hypothetical protein